MQPDTSPIFVFSSAFQSETTLFSWENIFIETYPFMLQSNFKCQGLAHWKVSHTGFKHEFMAINNCADKTAGI